MFTVEHLCAIVQEMNRAAKIAELERRIDYLEQRMQALEKRAPSHMWRNPILMTNGRPTCVPGAPSVLAVPDPTAKPEDED